LEEGFIKASCTIQSRPRVVTQIKMQATHTTKKIIEIKRISGGTTSAVMEAAGCLKSEDDTHWVIVSSMHRCTTGVAGLSTPVRLAKLQNTYS